jgi:hypothetical protein
MGLDDFDEFPLPDPPLIDDPFDYLFIANIAAMEATPNADEASNSEYKEDEEGEGDDNDE